MPEMTPIAVAIVNHNTRGHLRECLATVQLEAPPEVVVVDNASWDGSAEMVRAQYPSVTLRANKKNLGYGAAANQAFVSSTAPYVLLLNGDTLLQPGALAALSGYLALHRRAAIVGPRLVNPDGTVQASCYPFPTPLDTFLENSKTAVVLGRLIRRYVPIVRNSYLRTWSHRSARVVPWVKGAALVIRREALAAVGGFDESYFMYFEDADLCYRLNAAGWQVHFAPVTTVVHIGGASSRQCGPEIAVRFLASTIQFYRQHASGPRLAEVVLIVKSLMLARWISGGIRLCLTRNVYRRAEIAAEMEACRVVVLSHWRNLATCT